MKPFMANPFIIDIILTFYYLLLGIMSHNL